LILSPQSARRHEKLRFPTPDAIAATTAPAAKRRMEEDYG